LDGKEFQDLKMFGSYIEKKPVNTPVKKIKINKKTSYQIKPNKKYDLKKIFILLKKKIPVYAHKFLKIIKTIYYAFKRKIVDFNHRILLFKTRREIISKNKHIGEKRGYKVVEICKHRRNKTVIIRKRVFNQLELWPLKSAKNDKPALFYLTLNENEGQQENEPETYIRSKKSVWDFPVDYKEK